MSCRDLLMPGCTDARTKVIGRSVTQGRHSRPRGVSEGTYSHGAQKLVKVEGPILICVESVKDASVVLAQSERGDQFVMSKQPPPPAQKLHAPPYLFIVKVEAKVPKTLLKLSKGQGMIGVVVHDLEAARKSLDPRGASRQGLRLQPLDGILRRLGHRVKARWFHTPYLSKASIPEPGRIERTLFSVVIWFNLSITQVHHESDTEQETV